MKTFILISVFFFFQLNVFSQCTHISGGRSHSYNIGSTINDNGVTKKCVCDHPVQVGQKCISASWQVINTPPPPPPTFPHPTPVQSKPQSNNGTSTTELTYTWRIYDESKSFGDGAGNDKFIVITPNKFIVNNPRGNRIEIQAELLIWEKKVLKKFIVNKEFICNISNCSPPDGFELFFDESVFNFKPCTTTTIGVVLKVMNADVRISDTTGAFDYKATCP